MHPAVESHGEVKEETVIALDSPRTLETVEAVAKEILSLTKYRNPTIGIVCGSGLGKIADLVQEADKIPYSSINGFPRSTVPGHSGYLIIGKLPTDTGGVNVSNEVIVMQGRCHSYEGYSHWHASLPIRVMQMLGVRILVLTSAVGSLKQSIQNGDVVVLRDHLNLPAFGGRNPLFGLRDPRLGPRILPVDNMYDKKIRKLALKTAEELHLRSKVHVGNLGVGTGPLFEGVAEAKWFASLGLDVMGMSIAHEVIQARHSGMKVLAMVVVSNGIATGYDFNAFTSQLAEGKKEEKKDAEHLGVLETCSRACEYVAPLLLQTLQKVFHQADLFELTTYPCGRWKD